MVTGVKIDILKNLDLGQILDFPTMNNPATHCRVISNHLRRIRDLQAADDSDDHLIYCLLCRLELAFLHPQYPGL